MPFVPAAVEHGAGGPDGLNEECSGGEGGGSEGAGGGGALRYAALATASTSSKSAERLVQSGLSLAG